MLLYEIVRGIEDRRSNFSPLNSLLQVVMFPLSLSSSVRTHYHEVILSSAHSGTDEIQEA